MEESANSVILLIGLAVGVDYSMFYLRRKMEERDAGRSSEAALEFAAATSGSAVLVSGLTVLIAMAGMFLAGNAVFTSFAVGTMLVVAVAMIGSVTVLPAVLSKLGDNVEKGARAVHRPPAPPQPRRVARLGLGDRPRARAPGRRDGRAPPASCWCSRCPALNMHTINPGAAGLPHDLPIMQTYDRIQAEFPGGPMPALVVVEADDVTTPAVHAGHRGADRDRRPARRARSSAPNKNVAIVVDPAPGQRHRRALGRRADEAARPDDPGDDRPRRRHRDQRDRHDRRLEGLQRPAWRRACRSCSRSCSASRSCCCSSRSAASSSR